MVKILSILAALISLFGQLRYIRYVVTKRVILNKVTWAISAAVMCLQAGTYFEIVKTGNPLIAGANIIAAASFVFIFLYSFFTGRYARLSPIDRLSLFVGLATVVAWKMTGDARIANLILQIAVVVSFVPTIVGLFEGRLREKPMPWFVGATSYLFVIAAVIVQSGFSNPSALVYPLVVGVGINGFIGLQAAWQESGRLASPSTV